jgi:hypothetical protein
MSVSFDEGFQLFWSWVFCFRRELYIFNMFVSRTIFANQPNSDASGRRRWIAARKSSFAPEINSGTPPRGEPFAVMGDLFSA